MRIKREREFKREREEVEERERRKKNQTIPVCLDWFEEARSFDL